METKLEGCANVNKGVDFIFLKKKEDKIVQDSKNVVYTLFKAC